MEIIIGKYYWKAYDITKSSFSIAKFLIARRVLGISNHYWCYVVDGLCEHSWMLTEPFFETHNEAIDYAKQEMEALMWASKGEDEQ
jgi:hypothetical protein